MANLWTLGGLSMREVVRRTIRESWQDAVFGQAGRMAFYHFLAIFPSLFLMLAFARLFPTFDSRAHQAVQDLARQILPEAAAGLFERTLEESAQRTFSTWPVLFAAGGALWAACNGTWALIYGLNTAYEVKEKRSSYVLATTIAGLTCWLAISAVLVMLFILFGASLFDGSARPRMLEWAVVAIVVSLSFAVFYRFAPNLRDHQWQWSTPGAVCALLLWIASSVGLRLYFEHINDYRRSYGHLNGVVMLLLWLYVTNGSVLIGGEMNSEIEKAAGERDGRPRDRSGS